MSENIQEKIEFEAVARENLQNSHKILEILRKMRETSEQSRRSFEEEADYVPYPDYEER